MAAVKHMEYEQVVKFLELYKNIDGNVRFFKSCIKKLNDEYYLPPGGASYDGLPKGNKCISTTEELAINIPDGVSLEIKQYEKRVSEYQLLKTEILREISSLSYRQKTIIFDKYVNNMNWEQVAVRNDYSSRHCKNIRREAIKCLMQRFEKNKVISEFTIE